MRFPAVSGLFYPSDREELLLELRDFDNRARRLFNGQLAIVPHAGYIYSGLTAMHSFKNLALKENIVLIGPNHYSVGKPIALSNEDWLTPLGILRSSNLIKELNLPIDNLAHFKEHSIEVQLPFVQYFNNQAKIIPISIAEQTIENAELIFNEIKDLNATFIFSSDFSHYVPASLAREEDELAIELIKQKKVEEFYQTLIEREWSICGYGAIMVFMFLAKHKNLTIDLVRYSNSSEANGDQTSVVAYASIVAH